MTVEQIAIRQEVRQLLNEAGINKNTLKEMVKEVLSEEIQKACVQAMNEKDTTSLINERMDNAIRNVLKTEVRDELSRRFRSMSVTVDVTDDKGTSSLTQPGRFIG